MFSTFIARNWLVLLLLVAGTVCAQAQQDDKTSRAKDPSPAVQTGVLAGELAAYGYRNNVPMALATAAQMLLNYPPRALASEKQEAGAAAPATGATKTARSLSLDPAKLLQDARNAAQNDPATLAMIAKIEQTPKSRGRVYGPANVTRRVEAESSYTDYILFEGNALAEVAIVGDGDCDLDLYVYDSNGNLIGKDDDMTDRCYVSFYPNRQASFRVKIINRGRVYANYVLITN